MSAYDPSTDVFHSFSLRTDLMVPAKVLLAAFAPAPNATFITPEYPPPEEAIFLDGAVLSVPCCCT